MSISPDDPTIDPVLPNAAPTRSFTPFDHAVTWDRQSDPVGPTEQVAPGPVPSVPGYGIEQELGRGGMGVVYKAHHHGLNRTVALKMILAGTHATSDQIVRFLAEAETAARLQHHGIAQVFDTGSTNGLPYFAMEYVGGGSLFEYLKSGPLPAREASRVVGQLAEAISHAHAAGIVHRDLKPANILMTKEGDPKITDFGLAKLLESGDGLTQPGAILGTPAYMSPEQARGDLKSIGPSSDVYSLGAILFECLTGHPPFRGGSPTDTLRMVLHERPQRDNSRYLPRDLETVALKCLEKDPARRYRTAKELAADLNRFLDGRPVLARRVGPIEQAWRWAKRNQLVAGLLTAVGVSLGCGAVAATVLAIRASRAAHRADENALAYQTERDEAVQARNESARLSDEAQRQLVRLYLATGNRHADAGEVDSALVWYNHSWQTDQGRSLPETSHRLRLGLGVAAQVPLVGLAVHDAEVADARVDATGQHTLVRTDNGRAVLWDLRKGCSQTLSESSVSAVALTSDGRYAVIATTDGTIQVFDSSNPTSVQTLRHQGPVEGLDVTANGEKVATSGPNGIVVWQRSSGEKLWASTDLAGAYFVRFSPDGLKLASAHRDDMVRVSDVAKGRPLTKPLPHSSRSWIEKRWNYRVGPVFSPDGQNILVASSKSGTVCDMTLWSITEDRKRWGPVRGGGHAVVFRDDGKQLLSSGHQCAIHDAVTGAMLVEIPSIRHTQRAVFLAHDLIATATTGGLIRLFRLSPDNSPPIVVRSTQAVDSAIELTAMKDGRHLFFAGQDGTARLYDLSLSPKAAPYQFDCGGADLVRLLDEKLNTRRFSADGALECRTDNTTRLRLGKRNGPLDHSIDLPSPISSAFFSRKGHRLLIVTAKTVQAWDGDTGRPLGPLIEHGIMPACMVSSNGDGTRIVVCAVPVRGLVRKPLPTATVAVFDTSTGHALHKRDYLGKSAPILDENYPVLSDDGSLMATGDFEFDGGIEIWDVNTGKLIRTLKQAYRGHLYHLEFSIDGQRLLVDCSGRQARLWDIASGTPAGPPVLSDSWDGGRRIAPDGRTISTKIVGSRTTSSVILWDGLTGERFGSWSLGAGTEWFDRSGRRLLVGGLDQLQIAPLEPIRLSRASIGPVIELLTSKRVDPATEGIELLPKDALRRSPDTYLDAFREWRN